jgi:hypothetical protein
VARFALISGYLVLNLVRIRTVLIIGSLGYLSFVDSKASLGAKYNSLRCLNRLGDWSQADQRGVA